MNIKTPLKKIYHWFDQLAVAFDQSSPDAILQQRIDHLQKQINDLKNQPREDHHEH